MVNDPFDALSDILERTTHRLLDAGPVRVETIPPRGRYAARVFEQDEKIRLADRLPSLTSLPRRPGTRSTLSPQVPQHCVEPQHVGLNAEPGDEPDASLRQQRTQAALLDVGHMDLAIGDGHRAE